MIHRLLSKLLPKPKKRRRILLRTKGSHYDLEEIYQEINDQYFNAELDLKISWFGTGQKVPRTRILFGSYRQDLQLVRVNRLLDKPDVPKYFVQFIVYHEMLHHICPPIKGKRGRRQIHHSAFKTREKEFTEYELAKSFTKKYHTKTSAR